jgi:hypothetical protein
LRRLAPTAILVERKPFGLGPAWTEAGGSVPPRPGWRTQTNPRPQSCISTRWICSALSGAKQFHNRIDPLASALDAAIHTTKTLMNQIINNFYSCTRPAIIHHVLSAILSNVARSPGGLGKMEIVS